MDINKEIMSLSTRERITASEILLQAENINQQAIDENVAIACCHAYLYSLNNKGALPQKAYPQNW